MTRITRSGFVAALLAPVTAMLAWLRPEPRDYERVVCHVHSWDVIYPGEDYEFRLLTVDRCPPDAIGRDGDMATYKFESEPHYRAYNAIIDGPHGWTRKNGRWIAWT